MPAQTLYDERKPEHLLPMPDPATELDAARQRIAELEAEVVGLLPRS